MKEYAYTEKHMGTDTTVSVVANTSLDAQIIAQAAFDEIIRYEHIFSRFLSDSELSGLNRELTKKVSQEFYDVVEKSFDLYQKTGGAFNPLVQIRKHGYDRDFKLMDRDTNPQDVEPYNIDFNTVLRDDTTNEITLQKGQQFDFGGLLKGYVATKLAQELFEAYTKDCAGIIINLGGDLHTQGYDENGEPFSFYLYNPITEKETEISLTNRALATSGSYKRVWGTDTIRNHILAKDGLINPDTDVVSASIIHKDGAYAEAYATLFMVEGPLQAQQYIPSQTYNYFVVMQNGDELTNIV